MATGDNKPRFSNPVKNARAILRTIAAKVEGTKADIKRGHLLHKQGFGRSHDSALKLARKWKSNIRPVKKR